MLEFDGIESHRNGFQKYYIKALLIYADVVKTTNMLPN